MLDRERAGHEASPSAVATNRQSGETIEAGGQRGFAGNKVLGRKWPVMVDPDDRPLVLQVYPASVQVRDGAVRLPARPTRLCGHALCCRASG